MSEAIHLVLFVDLCFSSDCKRLGSHAWLAIANLGTELLIIIKYGQGEFPAPAPLHIKVFWAVFIAVIAMYCLYQFAYRPWKEAAKGKQRKSE
jgi:phosphatidylserine synthase 2